MLPLCAAGVTIEEVSDDQETVGTEAGGDSKDAGETPTPQEPPRALGLELVKSPQDGSADAVVSLVLGSSYVVYHAAALTRLQDFFRTEQVCCSCWSQNVLLATCCLASMPTSVRHSAGGSRPR